MDKYHVNDGRNYDCDNNGVYWGGGKFGEDVNDYNVRRGGSW